MTREERKRRIVVARQSRPLPELLARAKKAMRRGWGHWTAEQIDYVDAEAAARFGDPSFLGCHAPLRGLY